MCQRLLLLRGQHGCGVVVHRQERLNEEPSVVGRLFGIQRFLGLDVVTACLGALEDAAVEVEVILTRRTEFIGGQHGLATGRGAYLQFYYVGHRALLGKCKTGDDRPKAVGYGKELRGESGIVLECGIPHHEGECRVLQFLPDIDAGHQFVDGGILLVLDCRQLLMTGGYGLLCVVELELLFLTVASRQTCNHRCTY